MLKSLRLSLLLGTEEIREAYRRSFVGPFWITLGLAVQVATIGVVFSLIFSVKLENYLPYLAISLVMWNLIQFTINESCQAFISAERMIKQIPLPMLTFVLRVIWKNLLISAHTLIVVPIVFVIFGAGLSWPILFLPVGFILVVTNLAWIGVILSVFSARFRDVPPIVQSLLTMVFYVTPVIWLPEAIPSQYQSIVLGINPAYHLMEVIRRPFLGELPSIWSVMATLIIGIVGTVLASLVMRKFQSRIAFWI